jgi:hypothetical protein
MDLHIYFTIFILKFLHIFHLNNILLIPNKSMTIILQVASVPNQCKLGIPTIQKQSLLSEF